VVNPIVLRVKTREWFFILGFYHRGHRGNRNTEDLYIELDEFIRINTFLLIYILLKYRNP
jgi:hypothetical protein